MSFAVWVAVTVLVPLVFYEATHRWEEDQDVSMALWWTLAAVPVLGAMVAARWAERAGQNRAIRAFLAAATAGTLISVVFLGGTMAFYQWVIPLSGAMDWPNVWWSGLLVAVVGAATGYPIGRMRSSSSSRSTQGGYIVGAIVAVAGAFLTPVIVRLGAEDSTSRYDEGQYGGIGLNAALPGRPGALALPSAGRYAISAMGFSPHDPDCMVRGPGQTTRRAEAVSIPPSDYGGDSATYAWVASFTVPGPGTYTLICNTGDEEASYTVGEVPQIRGAVAALIHWPVPVILLVGSTPGLLIIANAFRRRVRQPEPPVPE